MLIVREDIIGLGMPYRPEIEIRILFTRFTDCIWLRKHGILSPRAGIS